MQTTDLFIKNGLILTYDREPFVGSLAVQAGKIIDLGATAQLEQKYLPTETLDATGKIVMPGFVNTHTHVAMSYFKGLADDLPLMVWLSQHIWPREAHFVNPEFVKDSTLHGCAEMIRNGVTTFNDMYFYSDEAAQSAQKAGIRAVLGETVLDHPIVNCHNADEVLAYILKLDNKYKNNSLIDISVAPHAIYTCSKENLIKAKDFAQKHGLLLHIHLSETRQEVEDSQKNFGMRPAEYLDSIGFFESRVVAAHSVWLDENESDLLAKHPVSLAFNLSSNLKLASGFASFVPHLQKGINLSIGTDGVASNNNLSMLQEMTLLSKLQKALNNDPTAFPAKQVVEMATLGGAKALGKEAEIGSIEIGKKADMITLDTNCLETQPMYNPFSHLVYALNSGNITDTIIDGKIVMKNRRLLTVNENELIAKAQIYREKIKTFQA